MLNTTREYNSVTDLNAIMVLKLTNMKGHNSVKTIVGVKLLVFFTSSDDASYCTKLKGFQSYLWARFSH